MRDAPVIPIAIIGMACRLPGRIDSLDALWEALLRGEYLVTEIPAERWDADEYYGPEQGVPGLSISRWGGFIDDVAGFDPEHRLLLETGYSTRFPTSERSHYARVIASSNECCSDIRSRGCEGGVAKTMEALTDALVAPILLAPPAPTSRGIFSATCRRDPPHRRRARGGPGVSVRPAAASEALRAARLDANSKQLDGKVTRYR